MKPTKRNMGIGILVEEWFGSNEKEKAGPKNYSTWPFDIANCLCWKRELHRLTFDQRSNKDRVLHRRKSCGEEDTSIRRRKNLQETNDSKHVGDDLAKKRRGRASGLKEPGSWRTRPEKRTSTENWTANTAIETSLKQDHPELNLLELSFKLTIKRSTSEIEAQNSEQSLVGRDA